MEIVTADWTETSEGTEDSGCCWKLTLAEQDEYEESFVVGSPVEIAIPAAGCHSRGGASHSIKFGVDEGPHANYGNSRPSA